MTEVIAVGSYILANWQELLGAVTAVLVAMTGLFMLIPGEQPEKTLKVIADFLAKFSKK